MKKYLCFDIDNGTFRYGIVSQCLDLMDSGRMTFGMSCKEELFEPLCDVAARYKDQVDGISITMPGVIDRKKGIAYSGGVFRWVHNMEYAEEETDRLISNGLLGIKLHPDFQKFAINDEKALRLYEIAGEKLPFLIHTGDKRYKYSNPSLMADAARRFPHVRFIAAHFGGWSEWDDAERELAGLDNIFVDTSSSFYSMNPEKAAELINRFGSDRVFFGTDYPMWRAKDDLKFLEQVPVSDDVKEKVLWKNINSFLGLGLV